MPTITAETVSEEPSPRVGVTIVGLSAGDHVVTVWRTTGGERVPVRGARTIPAVDSLYVEDFEAPLGRDVTYELEVLSGADVGVQGVVVDAFVPSEYGYIQDPVNPASALRVSAAMIDDTTTTFLTGTFSEVTYKSNLSTFNVIGSTRPVVIAGRRSAPSGIPFSMLTMTEAENVRLRDLVQSSPLLVIRSLPSWGTRVPPSATYASESFTEKNALTGDELTVWETTGDVVRSSSARIVTPSWTYQDVAEIFATYDQKQSAATGLTYLEDQKNPANV